MVSKLFLVEMAFGGYRNCTFFIFGGKELWRKRLILFWLKRETPVSKRYEKTIYDIK
jgi:hypothetical protein